jgi:hypothetical protein
MAQPVVVNPPNMGINPRGRPPGALNRIHSAHKRVQSQLRQRICRNCGTAGHNIRTCRATRRLIECIILSKNICFNLSLCHREF